VLIFPTKVAFSASCNEHLDIEIIKTQIGVSKTNEKLESLLKISENLEEAKKGA